MVHEVNWQKKVIYEYHNLPEYLSRFGHRVFVVDYDDCYSRSGLFDVGTLKTRVFENSQRAYQNGKITLYRPGQIAVPILNRLSGALLSYHVVRRLIRDKKIDAVFLFSVPTNGLGTVLAAHSAGVPVLFRTIDILHELVPNRWLRLPTLWCEKMVYPLVDKIVALTPQLGDYTVKLGANRDRVELLMPGVDTDVFCPGTRDRQLMERWGIEPEDRIIVFLGTLFPFCGMDTVVAGFNRIRSAIPRARLLVVGGGPLLDRLKEQSRNLGLERAVTFTGFQPYKDMPRYIRLAELSVNPFRICPATREIIPTKLLQYLSCGVPLLATPLPGTLDILDGESQGVVYQDIDDEFIEKIIWLLKDTQYLEALGESARAIILKNHDWSILAKRLEKIIDKTVKEGLS